MLIAILAGGSGTRLWPISRESHPKQFLDIDNSGFSLFQKTILRSLKISKNILVIGNKLHGYVISSQIEKLKLDIDIKVICEPLGKNTMPSALISCLYAKSLEIDRVLLLPADHLIENEDNLSQYIKDADSFLDKNKYIITFGIKPSKPHTGYGYIHANDIIENGISSVLKFKEKPDFELANEYFKSGNYLWNAGIFLYNVDFIIFEAKKYDKILFDLVTKAYENINKKTRFLILGDEFYNISSISIDYAILEKSEHVYVKTCADMGWSDLGGYGAIYDILPKDDKKNCITGSEISLLNSSNCHVVNNTEKLLVANNIQNLLIVNTHDALLICDKNDDQGIKNIVNQLKEKQDTRSTQHSFDYRPWGKYENILEGDTFKIKRITIKSNAEISYQLHYKRSEHWVVISGVGVVTLNDKEIIVNSDESIYIPRESKHKIRNNNNEDLVFIEVQQGSYFGEDDIVRIDDKYGRD